MTTTGDRASREAALVAAYEAHAKGIAALASRLLRDADAARDVCQETFVVFHRRMDEVRDEPGPWLRAVAWRLSLDRLRRRRTEARALDAVAREDRGVDALDPAASAADAERRARILAALADLPDRQREVIALRVLGGESFPRLARSLEISEGSAKTHLRRGLERLRRTLAAWLPTHAVTTDEGTTR